MNGKYDRLGNTGAAATAAGRGDSPALIDIAPPSTTPGTPGDDLQFQTFLMSTSSTTSNNTTANTASGNMMMNGLGGGGSIPPYSQSSFMGPQPEDSETSSAPSWSARAKGYFDIDTDQVVARIVASLIPSLNLNHLFTDVVEGHLDLYGPFWIPTTVIFCLFVASSVAKSIMDYLYATKSAKLYDIDMLSSAVGTIYTYVLLLPTMLWGIGYYFKAQMDFMYLIVLYGYSMSVWVAVSLLCIIPSEFVKWILVLVGFTLSGYFLIRNVSPMVYTTTSDARAKTVIPVLMFLCHGALTLLFKFQFFPAFAQVAPDVTPGLSSQLPNTIPGLGAHDATPGAANKTAMLMM